MGRRRGGAPRAPAPLPAHGTVLLQHGLLRVRRRRHHGYRDRRREDRAGALDQRGADRAERARGEVPEGRLRVPGLGETVLRDGGVTPRTGAYATRSAYMLR